MKKSIYMKSGIVALALVLVSVFGASAAFGYGYGYGYGYGSTVVTRPVIVTPKFMFNMNLRMGMRNADVLQLQSRLAAEGYFSVAPTGYFGPITFAAVKAYQAAHPQIGYVTGFFGPLTRGVINM